MFLKIAYIKRDFLALDVPPAREQLKMEKIFGTEDGGGKTAKKNVDYIKQTPQKFNR